jgi:hypothetical protein
MSDVLIRDVPDDVLTEIDHLAGDLGLSRNEFLRRQLTQVACRTHEAVTAADLQRFSHTVRDLADPDVMDQAWS